MQLSPVLVSDLVNGFFSKDRICSHSSESEPSQGFHCAKSIKATALIYNLISPVVFSVLNFTITDSQITCCTPSLVMLHEPSRPHLKSLVVFNENYHG